MAEYNDHEMYNPYLNRSHESNRLSFDQKKKLGYLATAKLRHEVLYLYRGRCFVCGIEEWENKKALHLHRIVPGRLGGTYDINNVIPVCQKCHRGVENKTWDELELIQHSSTIWV